VSRNFTHDVLNVCKEPNPSSWKQAREVILKSMQLESSQRALRREESSEGKWNLEEEESSDTIV